MPISFLLVKVITKDTYIRKIYLYGLCFSNFGFVGNAVVSALFPDIFFEYVVFTLTLWIPIYLWGVPVLLMSDGEKKPFFARLKAFVNPMFISMLIGMVLGLVGAALPTSINTVIDVSASCMSPVAMILTGITVSQINLKQTFSRISVYVVSILRLLVYPLIGVALFALIPLEIPSTFVVCAICSLAMPLGLNTIVIPAAYGKDTSVASGMALVSHSLAVITIPFVFILLRMIL